jgi:hypothetical protein
MFHLERFAGGFVEDGTKKVFIIGGAGGVSSYPDTNTI